MNKGSSRMARRIAAHIVLTSLLLPFCSRAQTEQTVTTVGCVSPPNGLVGWWRAENTFADQMGAINGTAGGDVTFGPGKVGNTFVLDGNGDGVTLGSPAALQVQTFTIEAWIQRTDSQKATRANTGNGGIFLGSLNGFGFALHDTGLLLLTKIGVSAVYSSQLKVTDTSFHHVAVTKNGGTVVFYVDGVPETTSPYNVSFDATGPMAIGALGSDLSSSFLGNIDELSFYNRDLTTSEIQSIYSAGSSGKCSTPPTPIAPSIVAQPVSAVVAVGGTVAFTVSATGTAPLTYQWSFKGAPIQNATSATLVLSGVTSDQAGSYTVTVANSVTTVVSDTATLTVVTGSNCDPIPSGLVAWWRGENSFSDELATDNGTAAGDVTFGPGNVGKGFVLDGLGDAVALGAPANLQLQNFTIEGWIKRADPTRSTRDPNGFGNAGILLGTIGAYGLAIMDDGRPLLTKIGVSAVFCSQLHIADTSFHHLAVTKSGSTVIFYVDGVSEMMAPYDPGFIFQGAMAIGGRGDNYSSSFWGTIDELSVYNRALAGSEVQAIFQANQTGKCAAIAAPVLTSSPKDQTVWTGSDVMFTAQATGSGPLSYQWNFKDAPISGATSAALILHAVTSDNAGAYTVTVSNSGGSTTSQPATLTVTDVPPCVPAPAGLISWWRGDIDPSDVVGRNSGTLAGNAALGLGHIRGAFVLDGNGDGVSIPDALNLHLQDFTIEGWVQRSDATHATKDPNSGTGGGIFMGSWGAYGFSLADNGSLVLSQVGGSSVSSSQLHVQDTAFHHVAVTKSGSAIVFYVDGAPEPVTFAASFQFNGPWAIGARGSDLAGSFWGIIDELSIYNRALSSSDISSLAQPTNSGKCVAVFPPVIVSAGGPQQVVVGGSVTLQAAVSGSDPLQYQWSFQNTPVPNGTGPTLTLANVQFTQDGVYTLTVSNGSGVTTATAVLKVVYPAALVEAAAVSGFAGGQVTVPIIVHANGTENALSFSLAFPPSALRYGSISAGPGASGATVLVNTDQLEAGLLGVSLALPAGVALSSGAQQVAQITWIIATHGGPNPAPLQFRDLPIPRQLVDTAANILVANYDDGSVSLTTAELEGDLIPRGNPDHLITVADWVLVGRFAAQLETPSSPQEFQRADCAPASSSGDGAITITDWVQVGRYAAGLDPWMPLGGPTAVQPLGPLVRERIESTVHRVKLSDAVASPTGQVKVPVTLAAVGDENALGFSVAFAPGVLTFLGAAVGPDNPDATLQVNTKTLDAGRVGVAMALPPGRRLPSGPRQILELTFALTPGATGDAKLQFADAPVKPELSDAEAAALDGQYLDGLVSSSSTPTLRISRSAGGLQLSWPSWATGFVLEQSSGILPASSNWSAVEQQPVQDLSGTFVTLPLSDNTRFYRLHKR